MLQSVGVRIVHCLQEHIELVSFLMLITLVFPQLLRFFVIADKTFLLVGVSRRGWLVKLRARVRYVFEGYDMIFEGFQQVSWWLARISYI